MNVLKDELRQDRTLMIKELEMAKHAERVLADTLEDWRPYAENPIYKVIFPKIRNRFEALKNEHLWAQCRVSAAKSIIEEIDYKLDRL